MACGKAVLYVERSLDKIVIHFILQKPYGIPDETDCRIIFYAGIPYMPAIKPPYNNFWVPSGFTWGEEIELPEQDEVLVILFKSVYESDHGPNEHSFIGAFRKQKENK